VQSAWTDLYILLAGFSSSITSSWNLRKYIYKKVKNIVIPLHAVKVEKGVELLVHSFSLNTGWRWVVNYGPQTLYSYRNATPPPGSQCPANRRLIPTAISDALKKRNNSVHSPERRDPSVIPDFVVVTTAAPTCYKTGLKLGLLYPSFKTVTLCKGLRDHLRCRLIQHARFQSSSFAFMLFLYRAGGKTLYIDSWTEIKWICIELFACNEYEVYILSLREFKVTVFC
jgi:hypothetical protein